MCLDFLLFRDRSCACQVHPCQPNGSTRGAKLDRQIRPDKKALVSSDAVYRWFTCDHGQPEMHLFRCPAPVFVQQMSIHFADENPAILVAKPGCNRHKINSCHHAHGAKIMAQIMKSDPFNSRRFPRDFQTLAKTSRMFVSGPTPWRWKKPRAIGCMSRMHFTQKRSQLRI